MLKRLTCFVSGEHHYRVREREGRVFLECQQCGQRSTGLETSSRPALDTPPGPRPSPDVRPSPADQVPKADADEFLREMLANGPMRQADVTQAATVQGIAARTLRRARVRLGVVATKHGFGSGSFWVWRLRAASQIEANARPVRGNGGRGSAGRGRRQGAPNDAGQPSEP